MIDDVVLVTGAAGLLGRSLVSQLLGRGVRQIIACDVVTPPRRQGSQSSKVVAEYCDVASFESVLRVFDQYRPDRVFHVGAMLGPACDNAPHSGIQTNAMGTYHVLEAARLFGTKQVIFASSISVMTPTSADAISIDDNCATHPVTVYGAAKLFSENVGLTYKRLHGVDFRSLRLPAIIGPGAKTSGFAEWFNSAIAESVSGRPYSIFVAPDLQMEVIHVMDAARAFIELARTPVDRIRMVNYSVLGPSPRLSAQDLVDHLRAKIPEVDLEFKIDDRIQLLMEEFLRLPIDDRYARKEWGWRHEYDLGAIVDDFQGAISGAVS